MAFTKDEWEEVLKGLLSVPIKFRTKPWKKATEAIEEILQSKIQITPDVIPSELRYVPVCSLCSKPIKLGEDYVYTHSRGHLHYDCFHLEVPANP